MLKAVLLAIVALAWQSIALADNAPVDAIKVKARKVGEVVVIDVAATIAATPQETWAVMADFDHMPQFLSNVQSSKILEKNGNKWIVAQKVKSSHGIFSFAFDTVREVDLKPFTSIRSHLISGTMKELDSLTQLSPDGAGTLIVYHSESISKIWVPPVVGISIVENEIHAQFHEMEAEILKRKASAKPGSN